MGVLRGRKLPLFKEYNMNHHRAIGNTIKDDTVIINTEFGHQLEVKISSLVTIDPITEYPDNLPDMEVTLKIESVKTLPSTSCVQQKQIASILNNRGILPPGLDYDSILIGFVYSDESNPNNHHWWLDFRKGAQSVFNYFGDAITIKCPINTYTWPDVGFSHGRFKLSKTDVISIKDHNGTLVIEGKMANLPAPEGESLISGDYKKLRLRYSPRTDLWYCDILQENDIVSDTIECTSIIGDIPLISNRLDVGGKPKISMIVKVEDISKVARMGNTLIIYGKVS